MDNQKHSGKKILIIVVGVLVVVAIALLIRKSPEIDLNLSNERYSEAEKEKIRQELRQSAADEPVLTAEQKAKALENIKKNNTTTSVSLTAEQKTQITEDLKRKY